MCGALRMRTRAGSGESGPLRQLDSMRKPYRGPLDMDHSGVFKSWEWVTSSLFVLTSFVLRHQNDSGPIFNAGMLDKSHDGHDYHDDEKHIKHVSTHFLPPSFTPAQRVQGTVLVYQ